MTDLRAIVAPPADAPRPPDLGAAPPLPADYAELAREYGPGCFGGFLWLLVPGAANANLDLMRQTELRRLALREVRDDGEPLPYEPEDLIPWAITDNGDTLYWLTQGEPDAWTTVINEGRGPDWDSFDGGAAAFLAAWLRGEARPSLFPGDVPYEPETFEPA